MSDHLDAAALAHSMLAQAMAKPKYTAKDNAEHWRRIANERREAGLEGAARDAERRAWYWESSGRTCTKCGEPMEYENIPDERHITGVRAWSGWCCSNGHEVDDEPRGDNDE